MKLPDVYGFSSYQDFLINLLEVNAGSRGFSERNFARKLEWPPSLLADLKSRRKRLSVERAVQLAKTLKLDEFQSEYLVTLVLRESTSPDVQRFANSLIKSAHEVAFRKDGDSEICSSQELSFVLEYIGFTKRLPTDQELSSVLGCKCSDVFLLAKRLEKLGAIKITARGVKLIRTVNLHDEDEGGVSEKQRQYHLGSLRTYQAYLERGAAETPRGMMSGYIKLTPREWHNLRKRIVAFKNSMVKFEQRSLDEKSDELQMFQLEVAIFPVTPQLKMLSPGEQKKNR